jgi:cytochrome P450
MTTEIRPERIGGRVEIDLLDPDAYTSGQPFEQYRWLQENDPVHWHAEPDGPGFWAVTKYHLVKEIESNWRVFSSEPVTTIPDANDVGDDEHHHLIFSDPPHHTEHRKFLSPELSPIPVRNLKGHLDQLVDDIIDEVVERGECDLVPDLAGRLASYVTADLLGLPRMEVVDLYEASDRLNNSPTLQEGEGLAAMTEMFEHARAVWADRRATPRDDMLTRIAHGEIAGCPVDELQFAVDFLLLVVAGGDTTRNVVAGGMEALFQHPDQRALLAADPSLVPSAVEEMLRWVTPIVYQRRLTTVDAKVGDVDVPARTKVVSFYGAANRDPDAFAEPFRFDVRRTPNAHLAFGFGPHFCLGSHLARLELNAMFTAMLRRLPDLEPAGPTVWMRSDAPIAPTVIGPKSIPVRFTPGPLSGPPAASR